MTHTGLPLFCSVLSVSLWLSGCSSAGTAPSPVALDRAALVVQVRAEPKQGWRDPTKDASYGGPSQVGQGRQWETIDYAALGGIIVWVEPASDGRPEPTVIALADPREKPGDAGTPLDQFRFDGDAVVRAEDGTVFPVQRDAQLPAGVTGFLEVTSDRRQEPDWLFVAPSRHVQLASAGQRLVFSDLPPGAARVACAHPRLPGSQANITLEAGKTAAAVAVVGVNALPKAP